MPRRSDAEPAMEPNYLAARELRSRYDVFLRASSDDGDATAQPALDDVPGQSERGTRVVGALNQIPVLIRQLGADPYPLLAKSEVAIEDLVQSSSRLPYQKLMVLLNEAARQTRCPHFGLLAGQAWRLADLGLVGQIMSNSPSVNNALQELVLFQHLNSNGAAAFMLKIDDFVDLGYTFYIPTQQTTVQFYDAVLAAATNFMRELCGEQWAPTEVLFPHSTPVDLAPYHQHFRAALRFESTICALRFPSKCLSRRIVGARKDLHQLGLQRAMDAGQGSVVDVVSRTLRTLLLHGLATGNDVAQSLKLHRRTLSRHLDREGAGFQQILDQVRFTIAKELLESSNVAFEDITVALGYADIESFFRAFKRWTGVTPGAWRQSAC